MKTPLLKKCLALALCCCLFAALLTTGAWAADDEHQMDVGTSATVRPDLFGSDTKNLMPGDSASFTVRVTNSVGREIRLYFRAADTAADTIEQAGGSKEASDQLLSILDLTVSASDGTVLYKGSADGKSPAEGYSTVLNGIEGNQILLGRLRNAASTTLTVELTVTGRGMSNEWQNAMAMVDWEFGYTKVSSPPSVDPDEPTGSSSSTTPSTTDPSTSTTGSSTTDIGEEDVPLINVDDPDVPLSQPDEEIEFIPDGDLPLTGALAALSGNTKAVGSLTLLLLVACIVVGLALRKRTQHSK